MFSSGILLGKGDVCMLDYSKAIQFKIIESDDADQFSRMLNDERQGLKTKNYLIKDIKFSTTTVRDDYDEYKVVYSALIEYVSVYTL